MGIYMITTGDNICCGSLQLKIMFCWCRHIPPFRWHPWVGNTGYKYRSAVPSRMLELAVNVADDCGHRLNFNPLGLYGLSYIRIWYRLGTRKRHTIILDVDGIVLDNDGFNVKWSFACRSGSRDAAVSHISLALGVYGEMVDWEAQVYSRSYTIDERSTADQVIGA